MGLYWGYNMGIMGKKMEITIMGYLRLRRLGPSGIDHVVEPLYDMEDVRFCVNDAVACSGYMSCSLNS